MGRRGSTGPSTPLLLGLGAFMLLVGLGLGLLLSQTSCERKQKPAPPKVDVEPKPKPEPKHPPKITEPVKAPLKQEPAPALPKFALVVDDLGYAAPELVTRLCAQPIPFTVAVLPYQEFTRESANIAFEKGKEVMLHLPMEPVGYPKANPGPDAVMFNLTEKEIRERVRKALDAIPHHTGVNNHMGSRITPDRPRMTWVLQEIKARHDFFVDSRTEKDSVAFDVAEALGVRSVQRKVFLDDDKAFPEMEKQWDRALAIAKKEGEVLIIAHIYPETVEALEKLIPRTKGEVKFVKAGELAK
ncbi:MAG: divergent polysaccharide deacetylase family protein [Acidobacteriota bacterium]|nr:divergent polysaccharide deacetylase family protein [Acidobacteriota bacterium]